MGMLWVELGPPKRYAGVSPRGMFLLDQTTHLCLTSSLVPAQWRPRAPPRVMTPKMSPDVPLPKRNQGLTKSIRRVLVCVYNKLLVMNRNYEKWA